MKRKPFTHAEAERVGAELHDRCQHLIGKDADDLGWADAVQWVLRRANEIEAEREARDQ